MFAAADGCKKGWVVAMTPSWPAVAPPSLQVVGDIGELLMLTRDAQRVMLDMPIGLADRGGRLCDEEARRMLGGNSSRCFFAPPRGALMATSYEEFNEKHLAACGKKSSRQAFGLLSKIREVDAVMTPALQERVWEFHPELTFMHLAGTALASKHSAQGILARLALLRPLIPGLDEFHRVEATGDAGIDDVLDALVGLVAAARPAGRLPAGGALRDARGLRCEINY